MSDHTHAGTDCFDPNCGLRKLLDYDAVLDGLVEKAREGYRGVAPIESVLRAIDAPSLVLLLREARDLIDQRRTGSMQLIARIDAHLAPASQPSTSPADV